MARKQPDWTSVKALALKAIENGGRSVSLTTVEWDISGRCQRPNHVHLWARNDQAIVEVWDTNHYNATEPRWEVRWERSAVRLDVEMQVPCRKCEACLKAKASRWRNRTWSELRAGDSEIAPRRTWFGTITCRPSAHYAFRMKAAIRLEKEKGLDLEALPEREQFRAHEREIFREIQKMFKRLRKAGHRFRFVCVCESSPSHQDGLPHYHVLIHEVAAPIPHEALAGRRADRKRGTPAIPCPWPHGFVNVKLVDNYQKAAWYVAKYLTKDAVYKPRASLRYGREPDTVQRSPVAEELRSRADKAREHAHTISDDKKLENFYYNKNSLFITTSVTNELFTQKSEPDSPTKKINRSDEGAEACRSEAEAVDECPPF